MNENPCSNQEFHVLFEHGSGLKNTYIIPALLALQTRLIKSPMFLFAKTLHTVMKLFPRYDTRKYTADAIWFREIQFKKMDNLMF